MRIQHDSPDLSREATRLRADNYSKQDIPRGAYFGNSIAATVRAAIRFVE
jgi:hypothetical protein